MIRPAAVKPRAPATGHSPYALDRAALAGQLLPAQTAFTPELLRDRIIHAELSAILDGCRQPLPTCCSLILPYNCTKDFHGHRFRARDDAAYLAYLRSWFPPLLRVLKRAARSICVAPGGRATSCSR